MGYRLKADLTGRRDFGMLKVVRYVGKGRWECECACLRPDYVVVRGYDLLRGKYKSCGCVRAETREKARLLREERRGEIRKPGRPYGWHSSLAGMIATR